MKNASLHTEVLNSSAIPKYFSHYKYIKTIGAGSSAVVCLVKDTTTKQRLACKIVSREFLEQHNMFGRFDQEVRMLQQFDHPNIVKLIDLVFDPKCIYLIMEYCPNGELFSYIVDRGHLSAGEAKKLFMQLLSAVHFIHERRFAHRDLKPENVLLDHEYNIKLSDFGLSSCTVENKLLSTPCGSLFYAAPEIVNGDQYDGKKADIWSLGVILFTMITGSLPWSTDTPNGILKQVKTGNYSFPSTLSKDLHFLLIQMMSLEPDSRPTIEDIYKSEWLNGALPLEVPRAPTKRLGDGPDEVVTHSADDSVCLPRTRRRVIVRPQVSAELRHTTPWTAHLSHAESSILARKVPTTSHRSSLMLRKKFSHK